MWSDSNHRPPPVQGCQEPIIPFENERQVPTPESTTELTSMDEQAKTLEDEDGNRDFENEGARPKVLHQGDNRLGEARTLELQKAYELRQPIDEVDNHSDMQNRYVLQWPISQFIHI